MPSKSSLEATAPVGLVGKFNITTLVLSVIAAAKAAGFRENPSSFVVATGTATPCAITMLGEYET